jgi:putative transposase
MTEGLVRYYGTGHLHFITGSCYGRQPRLNTPDRRDLFLEIFEQTRSKYRFVVHGYVLMPEHFHLLMTEPEAGDPSVVMKVLKERFSRQVKKIVERTPSGRIDSTLELVWEKRFHDFNVWSERKRIEKLRYMHRNPVTRGLVEHPEEWRWSSFRSYYFGEQGLVRVNFQEWPVEIKAGSVETFSARSWTPRPLIRNVRE